MERARVERGRGAVKADMLDGGGGDGKFEREGGDKYILLYI